MVKRIKKIESGSNMEGSNMEGTKPDIKRVRLKSPNAPEYPPRVSLGRKRIDWGKKEKTPTGGNGSRQERGRQQNDTIARKYQTKTWPQKT